MPVAVVADAHLGGPGGPAGLLVEQLEALPGQECERLVLLGDLFQAWIGFERFETEDVRRILAVLRRLRADGLPIHYVEGNRDFFLDRSPYADAFTTLGTEYAFTAGDVRYLAVHGDGLDERDRQYHLWRRLSKSALSRFLIGHVPKRFAQRLVRSTEERLSYTNLEHKRQIPEEVVRRYGETRLSEGHDVLLLGHFHEPRCFQVSGGRVRILDAWFESRRLEWLPA